MIVAQAVVETGWGDSRFANEANNLFGIRTFDRDDNYMLPKTLTNWPGWGVKVFASKCDSVEILCRIINEVWAYAGIQKLRQRQLNDGYTRWYGVGTDTLIHMRRDPTLDSFSSFSN